MIINDFLDFQSRLFKISSIKSKIFDNDFEIMMNNLNLEYNLHIDDIFCKNKYKRYFLLFNESFKAFIDLFLLLIQSGCNKLFWVIGLDKRRDSYICVCLCIWDTWVNDSRMWWRSLEHFCEHHWWVCKFDISCQKKRVFNRFLNKVVRVSIFIIF